MGPEFSNGEAPWHNLYARSDRFQMHSFGWRVIGAQYREFAGVQKWAAACVALEMLDLRDEFLPSD